MLKRIEVSLLRPGMYLHRLEGPWLSHPFWRSKFLLTDPADIAALRDSAISAVWIDVSRGLDVEPAGLASAPEPVPATDPEPAAARLESPLVEPVPTPPTAPSAVTESPSVHTGPAQARDEELALAQQVIGRSREAVESMFGEARLGRALDFGSCRDLVEEISGSVARSPGALVSLARLKSRDSYTYLHSVAVCALMVSLGRQLGLSESAVREAGLAGLMHDLGKAVMPLELLNKPGRLSDEELELIRTHPQAGRDLLAEGGQATPGVLDVCHHHHERIDGTGYPERLRGEQISMVAKMGAVCDVYDAITSNRPYKSGWDPGESLRQMARWKGHFDERVFQAFVKAVGIYPVGALVRLQSGRLAVVVEQNATSLLAPRVKAFYDTKAGAHIEPVELDLREAGVADKVLGCEPADAWRFTDLDALWAGAAAA